MHSIKFSALNLLWFVPPLLAAIIYWRVSPVSIPNKIKNVVNASRDLDSNSRWFSKEEEKPSCMPIAYSRTFFHAVNQTNLYECAFVDNTSKLYSRRSLIIHLLLHYISSSKNRSILRYSSFFVRFEFWRRQKIVGVFHASNSSFGPWFHFFYFLF